ncbi:DUF481 domain-containing protein [Erythrobacteraceae bacterium CFH 75059]|uniref:DUF481 domain-containing protein n=1 Tax=Qipengyuania thermophila TaxID=2509361 RepID=UPI0010222ACF|nr:DUF481 domain-containing protein [Qipengyuania thermophila]TCD05116.1 DUF481 domain-containing protein [Erythrobacteraceae bacterium CFH 75059]
MMHAFAMAATLVLPLAGQAATLPEPLRLMIEAAMATGDADKVETVLDLARQTHPEHGDAIAALEQRWQNRTPVPAAQIAAAELPAEAPVPQDAAPPPARRATWSGRGELGGFRATGSGRSSGITAALNVTATDGPWQHKLLLRGDYQRAGERTVREQLLAAYEPRYEFSPRLFAYGLGQFETDRVQGFVSRTSLSGGIGHHLVDRDDLDLSIKAGPALRHLRYTAGGSDLRLAALIGVDFDWRITDRLTLSHDANAVAETAGSATVVLDSRNTNLNLVTALDAKVTDSVSVRVSYTVDYDSNPPPGGQRTDTLSRFSFVYGF